MDLDINKKASTPLAQQLYEYVLRHWEPHLYLLFHLCIPCLADIFIFLYLCQQILTLYTHLCIYTQY